MKLKEYEEEKSRLERLIRREDQEGEHTYSPCERCGSPSRSYLCAGCYRQDLDALVLSRRRK